MRGFADERDPRAGERLGGFGGERKQAAAGLDAHLAEDEMRAALGLARQRLVVERMQVLGLGRIDDADHARTQPRQRHERERPGLGVELGRDVSMRARVADIVGERMLRVGPLPGRDAGGRTAERARAVGADHELRRDRAVVIERDARLLPGGHRARIKRQAPQRRQHFRARLHRLAADHDAWDRLAELYENLAEDALTAETAADLLMEVAAIRERQGQPARAEAQYRRILGMRPDDAAARAKLEALYRGGGRWVELAASLEERTDPRLGTAAPEAERPALLRELAAIYVDHLAHPHDGIDTLERLRQLAPTDVGVLKDLGALYARVGRWSKVIETHGRIGEIAEGTAEAKDALRRVAAIYETELELPERAIETYQQLVAQWPDDADAFAALDRLCEAQARWADLVEVLRRRSALATSPEDRARLLARRAGVLMEWLAAPEEAAAALRHARTILPDDGALADRLVTALHQAARHREAAAVLEGRIAGAADRGVGAGELAALHIRLAQVRAEGLGDRAGARAALEHALRLVPDHPTALTAIAKLTTADDDPRAFIDAKLREAEAATDDVVRTDALYAAGVALRDRVNDPEGARAAFERILAVRPYHADAIWALAGLIEQGGDPETAARLLETRLDGGELAPGERARVLTQLAALARAAGVELVAERRLAEALDADGGHVPALIAMADLYADAQRWDDLATFLRDTIDEGVPDATPAVTAELHRRLAQAYEKQGKDDDAYETLLTADRLHRGHLLIKLALGENRYKARRWREAALHLAALASHEDAPRHASDVAQGLYHAALAEIRSLRPEKAPPLYARALELRPNYAPALQAMAELAMEQNDPQRAADLLTRQAMATDEPAERMRLFEALGDMALMMVAQGLSRAQVEDPAVEVAFPDSVVDMMRGNLGQPPGGWPAALRAKVLKGETPVAGRPGAGLPPADLEAVRARLSADLEGFRVDDEDLNGYLMYPKVFLDYMGRHRIYGPVRTLPTRTFFYGMQPGEEITAEIDPGKTLEIRLQTVGETQEDGEVRVFFELNGQPRVVRVPNRLAKSAGARRPKAEDGNPRHLGAPMPGVVATLAVAPGQKLRPGDLLLTIEAMKMETGLHADREAVVRAVHVQPGAQIDAKDLLVEFD